MSNEEILVKKILFGNEGNNDIKFFNINHEEFVKFISRQLIIPPIYFNIYKKKLFRNFPKDLISYLENIFEINRNRNKKLLDEAKEISDILNQAGIEHIFLKGTANLLMNIYDNLGERMISDIDIFVKNQKSKIAYELLFKNGYNNVSNFKFFQDESKHFPRQSNNKKIFAIEVHKRLFKNKKIDFINLNRLFDSKKKMIGFNIPELEYLFLHNLYNHQINDYGFHDCYYNYRNIYDSFIYTKKMGLNLDFLNYNNNKYINSYIQQCSFLKVPIFDKFSVRKDAHYYRIIMKSKFNLYKKTDNYISLKTRLIKSRPRQLRELLTNSDYRKYTFKNLIKSFKP